MPKVKRYDVTHKDYGNTVVETLFAIYCPACKSMHHFRTFVDQCYGEGKENAVWEFNGDMVKPTFKPSLKLFTHIDGAVKAHGVCHIVVTDGRINYCGDCDHDHKNRSVPVPELPHNF